MIDFDQWKRECRAARNALYPNLSTRMENHYAAVAVALSVDTDVHERLLPSMFAITAQHWRAVDFDPEGVNIEGLRRLTEQTVRTLADTLFEGGGYLFKWAIINKDRVEQADPDSLFQALIGKWLPRCSVLAEEMFRRAS